MTDQTTHTDETATESPFDHIPFDVADIAGFCERLQARLSEGNVPEEFEFEGVDVDTSIGIRLVALASYTPENDPAARALAGTAPADGTLAGDAWTRMQDTRAALASAWGTPTERSMTLIEEDGEQVPETLIDALMDAISVHQGDLWDDEGRFKALLIGWTGEPGLSPLYQVLFLYGYEPDAADDAEAPGSGDASVDLVRAIAGTIKVEWDAFAMAFQFGDGYRSASGYAYAGDGAPIAISAPWDELERPVYEYLGQHLQDGDRLPAALLVQFDATVGAYEVTWEDEDEDRWHVVAANVDQLPEQMRPAFD